MNREIRYRGKRLDNGEWVYGNYIYRENEDKTWAENIITPNNFSKKEYKVHPDTVGQYIGLKEKNGNKIFDGDILRSDRYPFNSEGNDNYYAEVFWCEDAAGFYYETRLSKDSDASGISDGNVDIFEDPVFFEVIGNIHDNPELLKGGKDGLC